MNTNEKAKQVFDLMYQNDHFSQWLGIECLSVRAGACLLQMEIRSDMLNGFGVTHGGITYALADSALAFASNSHGRHALSIETSITHLRPLYAGDVVFAEATLEYLGHKIAHYRVTVRKDDGEKIALFKGTVYRKGEEWK